MALFDGVGAFAALNLNKLLGKLQAFSLSELDQRAALCRKAQTGTTRRAVETRM